MLSRSFYVQLHVHSRVQNRLEEKVLSSIISELRGTELYQCDVDRSCVTRIQLTTMKLIEFIKAASIRSDKFKGGLDEQPFDDSFAENRHKGFIPLSNDI